MGDCAIKHGVNMVYYFPGCSQSIESALIPKEFEDLLMRPRLVTTVSQGAYIMASTTAIQDAKVPPPLLAQPILQAWLDDAERNGIGKMPETTTTTPLSSSDVSLGKGDVHVDPFTRSRGTT